MNELREAITDPTPVVPVLGICHDCGEPIVQATFGAAYATGDMFCLPCAAEYTLPNDGDEAGPVG